MANAKYIRTDRDQIIVFDESILHSQFKFFNPVSAGFIVLQPEIRCYGDSSSLKLRSLPEDTVIARQQLIGRY